MTATERTMIPCFLFFLLLLTLNYLECVKGFVFSSTLAEGRYNSKSYSNEYEPVPFYPYHTIPNRRRRRHLNLTSLSLRPIPSFGAAGGVTLNLLSSSFLENDLVVVTLSSVENNVEKSQGVQQLRLCVVRPDQSVAPLCQRSDDVETDLYVDPRCSDATWTHEVEDDDVFGGKPLGEGWYGQRPVPSLGGGPGYGAEADDVWSVDSTLMEVIEKKGIVIPILDVGIAHGEKARGGAF